MTSQSFAILCSLLFIWLFLFLTDPLYSIYTPYFRIRKTKHFSRGPSCVLSLSGPGPSGVCSGCVCSWRWPGRHWSSTVPWRLGLQVCPGAFSSHILSICVKIKMQQLWCLQISVQNGLAFFCVTREINPIRTTRAHSHFQERLINTSLL